MGYGPSSLTLTAAASNGTAPFSYLWSNGATTNSISISPSTAGIHDYSLTITDALTCQTTITKQIIVTDVRCADKKVTVCHTNNKSLCISTNAVAAHLAHGCSLGSCENTPTLSTSSFKIAEQQIDDFMVSGSPNPTKTEFQINITGGDDKQNIVINVFDLLGRKIDTVKSSYASAIALKSNLSPGTYLVEIRNGMNAKTIKLVKQ